MPRQTPFPKRTLDDELAPGIRVAMATFGYRFFRSLVPVGFGIYRESEFNGNLVEIRVYPGAQKRGTWGTQF